MSEIINTIFKEFESAKWYDNADRDIAEDILLKHDRAEPENKQYDPKFCTGCRSVDNDADDYPCNECRRAYTDKFEPQQEEK